MLTVKEYAVLRKCNTSYVYELWRLVKQKKKTPAEVGFRIVKTKWGNGVRVVKA